LFFIWTKIPPKSNGDDLFSGEEASISHFLRKMNHALSSLPTEEKENDKKDKKKKKKRCGILVFFFFFWLIGLILQWAYYIGTLF
jgi:hypothetical protein